MKPFLRMGPVVLVSQSLLFRSAEGMLHEIKERGAMKRLGYFVFALSIGLLQNVCPAVADTPLTPGQTSQVQGFLQSQANWNNLIASELQKSTGTQVLAPAVGTAQGIDQHTIDGDCNINIVPPSQKGVLTVGSAADNDQTQVPMFTVTIDGQACPVQINASVDGEQTSTGFHAGFVVAVKIVDPTFAKQNDVDTLNMTMDMTAIMTQQPGSNTDDVQVQLSLKGQAHSLSLGNVTESASISTTLDITPPSAGQFLPAMTMKLVETLNYQFSGFSADLQSTMDLEGLMGPVTASYLVNGVSVSQQDYQAYLNSISLPLSQSQTSAPPQASSMNCEVRVYDANKVSKQALLDSISNHTPIAAGALLDDSKTASANWLIANGGLQARIDFDPQYVTLTLNIQSTEQSDELTLLTGQNGDVADQLGNYTFRLTCSTVTQ
jgi:hypothetical protein